MALRRKLGLLLFGCALLTTVLITFFVNRTIQHQFEQYMHDNQAKRNERLITYFEDYYQSHGTFDERAGAELAHEAYMNDYCLVLMDANSNVIWGMSPDEMKLEAGEIYQAKTYHLMVNDETIGYLEIGQHTPLLLSTEDIYFKQAINQSIVMSAVITIAVVGGISFIFSKPLSKPIKKVSEMALRLAQGDFKEEMIESINIEELDSLQKSMNLLASTLTSHEEARKQLVSDVSHELRTPLNILQTNLEVLKQFDTKTMKLELKPLDLKPLILQQVPEFTTLLRQKKIKLTVDLQEAWIEGDSDQLKQVFINLVSNAYKFTPEFGEVQICLTSSQNTVQVSICDTGIGVEKEHLSKLFDRFYRVDPSRHQTEGSGIGLTIVKKIVKLHGALIEVESEVGRGSTFILTFHRYSS